MFTSHRILLVAMAALMIGCGADADSPCTIDSDCAPGLWCSPHTLTCVEVDCDDGLCEAPEESLYPAETEGGSSSGRGIDGPKVNPLCDPSTGQAWRVTSFLVGTSGEPGQGLDVDQDSDTCDGIDGECSDGVDNSFSRLASLVNTFMTSGVANGDIRLALHIPANLGDESAPDECSSWRSSDSWTRTRSHRSAFSRGQGLPSAPSETSRARRAP